MKKAIRKNCSLMCDRLSWDDIKAGLTSKDLITQNQKGRIEGEKGDENKINAMLDILLKTDLSKPYNLFLDVLSKSGNAGETCANTIKNEYEDLISWKATQRGPIKHHRRAPSTREPSEPGLI